MKAFVLCKLEPGKEQKELIERRVILPLAEPERAAAHGVVPPRAIVLFGPPGTGKTTFARGIASHLGWPFVEIFPSRLAAEPGTRRRLAAAGMAQARSRYDWREINRQLEQIYQAAENHAAHRYGKARS